MQKNLDIKDYQIVKALFEHGFNSSSRFLSKKLNIPDRTISFRIKKMKENGLLQAYPLMHERRLGLGDCCIVIQESEHFKSSSLFKILEEIPYFYLISSTYGRFNGILCYCVYSLKSKHPREFIRQLKLEGLIKNFWIVEIREHIVCEPFLEYFDVERRKWIWNWKDWKKGISTKLKQERKKKTKFNLDFTPEIIDFKEIDVEILRLIKQVQHEETGRLTHSEIAQRLGTSTYIIKKRIQHLSTSGVIKHYLINFFSPQEGDILFIFLFMEISNSDFSDNLLELLSELPFQVDFFLETKTKICCYLRLSAQDWTAFLGCFEIIKDQLRDYFFQIVPHYYNERHHLFNAYNQKNKQWETPFDLYIPLISKKEG